MYIEGCAILQAIADDEEFYKKFLMALGEYSWEEIPSFWFKDANRFKLYPPLVQDHDFDKHFPRTGKLQKLVFLNLDDISGLENSIKKLTERAFRTSGDVLVLCFGGSEEGFENITPKICRGKEISLVAHAEFSHESISKKLREIAEYAIKLERIKRKPVEFLVETFDASKSESAKALSLKSSIASLFKTASNKTIKTSALLKESNDTYCDDYAARPKAVKTMLAFEIDSSQVKHTAHF